MNEAKEKSVTAPGYEAGYPVGTKVRYHPVLPSHPAHGTPSFEPYDTVVRSEAWNLGGEIVQKIKGKAGGFSVWHLELIALPREVVYFSVDGDGTEMMLSSTDPDEAIEAYLDAVDLPWPETVDVWGWARKEVDIQEGSTLDTVIEGLDEEYGDPDGGCDDPTEVMKEAERVFHAAIIAEYDPWACEHVKTVTVNVMEWVKKNRPDWLEEPGKEDAP